LWFGPIIPSKFRKEQNFPTVPLMGSGKPGFMGTNRGEKSYDVVSFKGTVS